MFSWLGRRRPSKHGDFPQLLQLLITCLTLFELREAILDFPGLNVDDVCFGYATRPGTRATGRVGLVAS